MHISKKYQLLLEPLAEYAAELTAYRNTDPDSGTEKVYDGRLAIAAYLFVLALNGDRLRFLAHVDREKQVWENRPPAGAWAAESLNAWTRFCGKTEEWRRKYGRLPNNGMKNTKKNKRGIIGNPWPFAKRRGSTGAEK